MNAYHFENDTELQLFIKNRTYEIKNTPKECIFNGRKYLKIGSLVEKQGKLWKLQCCLLIILFAIPALCSLKAKKKLFTTVKQFKSEKQIAAHLYVLNKPQDPPIVEKKVSIPQVSATIEIVEKKVSLPKESMIEKVEIPPVITDKETETLTVETSLKKIDAIQQENIEVKELKEQNSLNVDLEKLEPKHISTALLDKLSIDELKSCVAIHSSKPEMIQVLFRMLAQQIDCEFEETDRLKICYQELSDKAPDQIPLAFQSLVTSLGDKVNYDRVKREELEIVYEYVYNFVDDYPEHRERLNQYLAENVKRFFDRDINSQMNGLLHVLAVCSIEALTEDQLKFITGVSTRCLLFLYLEKDQQKKFIDQFNQRMMIDGTQSIMYQICRKDFIKIFSMLTEEEIETLDLNNELQTIRENK